MGHWPPVRMIALGFVAFLVLVGCEGTLHRETGVRLRVDSPALGRVDLFELLNADGERIVFDTSTMEFRPESRRHTSPSIRSLGAPYRGHLQEGPGRLLVTRLDDAE